MGFLSSIGSALGGALVSKGLDYAFGQASSSKAFSESKKLYATRYQHMVRDLRAAGLNPILAFGGMSPGSSPQMQPWGTEGISSSALDFKDIEKKTSEIKRIAKEQSEIIARTEVHNQAAAELKQKAQRTTEEIEKVIEETELAGARSDYIWTQRQLLDKQIQNLEISLKLARKKGLAYDDPVVSAVLGAISALSESIGTMFKVNTSVTN